ncbi:MAG: uracil-DNA glycosylase [Methylococcaceae bacterium]|nr:uracil-DNA glycosylase [Methylococcaceae bacterium]
MDNATRLQYLEAMGIDVWVSRHPPVAVQAPQATHVGDGLIENVEWAEHSESHQDSSLAQESIADQRETHQTHYDRSVDQSGAGYADTYHAESLNSWDAFYAANVAVQDQPKHHGHATDHAWTDLQHEVASCRACGLCETRTQTVFGVGNKHATWMLIGEAPGQNEDLQGEPFVGRAGQLLTEMLRAIGLKREEVYIANMLKCRPPNNRDPQADEVAACHNFLQRQIALLQPKIILAVGRIAAQNLLKTQQPLAKLRGVRHQLDNIPLIVIHHPAYLLRSLPEKAKAWEDLQFAMSVYKAQE